MSKAQTEVRLDGRVFPVLDRVRVGGQAYLVIERLGHFERPTMCVVGSGLTREVRCLQVLPYSRQNLSHLRLLSKISRPNENLPAIIGSHRQGDTIQLLTSWIAGPTLSDYLRECRTGREPWPSALVVIRLLHGLAHGCRLLHDRLGVVHGDLHPKNLVLCRYTKRLVPIDFGSAWNVARGAVRDSGDGVTRAFAAPETFEHGTHVGFQADQFSAMAVGYVLLTGETAYDGLGGRVAQANARSSACGDGHIDLTPPSQVLRHRTRLPEEMCVRLDETFRRGLAISASDRFATTREWIDSLQGLKQQLAGETIETTNANRWLLKRVRQLGDLFGWD